MCKLESCPVVPSEGDAVDGVLKEVLTDQVKQQLWECVLATSLRRDVATPRPMGRGARPSLEAETINLPLFYGVG